jgi:hypothetical protein
MTACLSESSPRNERRKYWDQEAKHNHSGTQEVEIFVSVNSYDIKHGRLPIQRDMT